MKSEKKQEYRSLRERYVHHFALFGIENILYALYKAAAWNNGVDYIHPTYDIRWNVICMKAGVLNLETGKYFEELVFTDGRYPNCRTEKRRALK